MTRLGRTELASHVRNELIVFLRDGTINEQQVTQTLDITGLQIQNLDRLKRIHFCLSDPVVKYVTKLQKRLRRIKTANQRQRVLTRGEVRGKIDWEDTLRHRYSDSIGDRSQFTCETPYTEYDIPENLVLKKLLWTIYTTVDTDLSEIDYAWRMNKWPPDQIAEFGQLYRRNIHLNRIRDGREILITPRMLSRTRLARQPLYRQAYTLYNRYERLLSNEADEDVKQLLRDTLIVPERLPRLFELFCVFQVINLLDVGNFQFQVIEPNANTLAEMETDEHRINVFHDRSGSFSFYVPLAEIETVSGGYFERYRNTIERHKNLVDEFLDVDSRRSLYSGRPDIVIELYEKTQNRERLTDVLLAEIKYTNSQRTFSRGLKELIEYMEFAQSGGYLTDQDIDVHGLVITDGVETQKRAPLDGEISHVTSTELLEADRYVEWLPERLSN